ncbi:hypothetical protein MM236_03195, partial [Belliella sp. DSM 107340]|nr:hypothetical protein [Belliella calami]
MNKNLLLLIFFFFAHYLTYAQVGIGTEDPHVSAALEIESTNKGILIPRMTSIQKESIQNPAIALLVFQVDETKGFYYWDGNSWELLKNLMQKNADWSATDGESEILNKPKIAKVGLSGEFSDLENIPEIVFASDTAKMLMPYLTLSRVQPFLDSKIDFLTFEKEIEKSNQAITTNANKITANSEDISDLNTEVGQNKTAISANAGDIATLNTAVSANTTDIQTNIDKITANSEDISDLNTEVGQNKTAISANAGDIATLNTAVSANTT